MDIKKDGINYENEAEWNIFRWHRGDTRTIIALTRAIKVNPQDFSAYYRLANILRKQEKYSEAALKYNIVISLNPMLITAYIELAFILANYLGRPEDALAVYERAVNANPDNYQLYNMYGFLLKQLNKYDEALQKYQKAIEIRNSDGEAYNNWGVILYDQQKYEDAILKFKEAVRLEPNQCNYYFNWGFVLQQQSKLKEALIMFQKGLEAISHSIFVLKKLENALEAEIGHLEKQKAVEKKDIQISHIQVTIDGMNLILDLAKAKHNT